MSPPNTMRPPDHIAIRIDGFEPSWAGPHPFEDGFCFGSEDGMVAFTDERGKVSDKPQVIALSREAVNGIAGIDKFLAVSTRQEVAVLTLPDQVGEKAVVTTFARGAHGVLASSTQHFVAPLGHGGVMMVKPGDGLDKSLREYPLSDRSLNLYQLYEMPGIGTRSLFIGACRSKGVGLIDYSAEKNELGLQTCTFPDIDVVDVSPVGSAAYPHAVVAAGIGGEVLLFRDIVNQEAPISLKYDQFAGKTYRILSSCGHLFVLTSKTVYVLGFLANRLTQASLGEHAAPVMTIPMEAIDANICQNRWLLAVMQDEVHRYDVHEIHDNITEFAANGSGATSPLPHSRLNFRDWQPGKGDPRRLQPAAGGMEPVTR